MESAFNSNLTDAVVGVPRNVVYREFAAETVLLNIETGLYHGLNPVAGRMLEALDRLGSVREAVLAIAQEYAEPVEVIERDLTGLCEGLLERGLLELRAPADG